MSIAEIFLVTVEVPNDVYEQFGFTAEYAQAVLTATSGHVTAGSNHYSDVTEWAEFHDRNEAEKCEQLLLEVVRQFQERLRAAASTA